MKAAEEVEFFIASGLTEPIIGVPTLERCGMTVNCGERTLQGRDGDVVKCAMTTKVPWAKNAEGQ